MCKDDIHKALARLEMRRGALGPIASETQCEECIRVAKSEGICDHDATAIILNIWSTPVATSSGERMISGGSTE